MRKRGSTLIELVIVMTVLAVVGGLISLLIIQGLDIWAYYRDYNASQANARRAMTKIKTEIQKIILANPSDFVTKPQEFRFRQVDSGGELFGFRASSEVGSKLYFYIEDGPTVNKYGSYIGPHNRFEEDGRVFFRFDLCDVATLEIRYFAVRPGDGNPVELTNPNDFANIPGYDPEYSKRLVQVYLESKVKDRRFPLGSVFCVRNY